MSFTGSDPYKVGELLHDGRYSRVCRAIRRADGKAVALKILKPEAATQAGTLHFRREYDLLAGLDLPGVIKVFGLEEREGAPMIVMEDIGGEDLERLLGRRPPAMPQFLALAIGLSDTLAGLHRLGIIHKDINPRHIIVNPATSRFRLIGFAIAEELPQRVVAPRQSAFLEGTLAYMSPEQTGRINRVVDSRTDFYSLGMTFYRILTGKLPFEARDPLGIVHWHIAGTPAAPRALDPGIPATVSRIVMKLIEKMAEDRYQSGSGLKADLERCLRGLTDEGIIRDFEPGVEDCSDQLRMPQKLYGREHELGRLLQAFELAAAGGRQLLLVAGFAGVGKTALAREMYKTILERQGYFIEGKFEQLQRNVPYLGWIRAFAELVNYFLMESEAELARRKQKIRKAVGSIGRVLTDVIPNLELIIGPQPAVPELGGDEALNRFNYAFQELVKSVATRERPLVVFLDDLQWIETASLSLLHALLTAGGISNILVIGAYRDNEVDALHPLMKAVETLLREEVSFEVMNLRDLSEQTINELIANTLHHDPAHTAGLTRLIYAKTGGNPFFVLQTLRSLVEKQAVYFDASSRCWQWNVSALEHIDITDNVAALMLGKIQKLAPEARRLLPLAAYIGFRFGLLNLSAVAGRPEEEILKELQPALREELIVDGAEQFQFAHDRVREAAYALIPRDHSPALHLEIGRLLLRRLSKRDVQEQVFTIADHLNRGFGLIEADDEKTELAQLNLEAGLKAKASGAYAVALHYLTTGIRSLPGDSWDARYDLAYNLHLGCSECEYLTGGFAEAEQRADLLLSHAGSPVDNAAVTRVKQRLYLFQGNMDKSIETGIACLRLFRIDIRPRPTWEQVQEEYDKVWRNLGERQIEDLIGLPPMRDPGIMAAMGVLSFLKTPAMFTDSNLNCLVVCHMVNLSLVYGNADSSGIAYVYFSQVLGPVFGRYRDAYRFGKLGYDMAEKLALTGDKAKIYQNFAAFISPFSRPLYASKDIFRRAFDVAVETGDLAYACFSLNNCIAYRIIKGDPLDEISREAEAGLAFVRKVKFELVEYIILSEQWLARRMQGVTGQPDQKELEEALEARKKKMEISFCFYHIWKSMACFMFGDYEEAIEAGSRAKEYLWTAPSFLEVPEYHYFSALSLAARYDNTEPERKSGYLETLTGHRKQLKEWADNCPQNFLNKHALVSAEIARINGETQNAMLLYEQAIRSARENGFIQNEGIGYERAAAFYQAQGFETVFSAYMREARRRYARWGAAGKVRQLEREYPWLREEERGAGKTGYEAGRLDMISFMKASQTISGEILLSRLMGTIIWIIVENAGAQSGSLLLERVGTWVVAARGEIGKAAAEIQQPVDMDESDLVSPGVVRFVARTREKVVLDDAANQGAFMNDPHIRRGNTRSLLCAPLLSRGRLTGILYLENNLATRAFTPERAQLLEVLLSQAATSLENARIHEALRESEKSSRRIVETATEGIWVLGHNGVTTTYVNVRMAEMIGYPARELTGRPFTDFMFEEDVPDHHKKMDNRRQGISESYERRLRRKDGKTVWTHVSATPIFDEERRFNGTFGMFTDITERKQAEEELHHLNEELDQRVRERTEELEKKNAELERMNRLFVGRELRMVELKERIKELEKESRK